MLILQNRQTQGKNFSAHRRIAVTCHKRPIKAGRASRTHEPAVYGIREVNPVAARARGGIAHIARGQWDNRDEVSALRIGRGKRGVVVVRGPRGIKHPRLELPHRGLIGTIDEGSAQYYPGAPVDPSAACDRVDRGSARAVGHVVASGVKSRVRRPCERARDTDRTAPDLTDMVFPRGEYDTGEQVFEPA